MFLWLGLFSLASFSFGGTMSLPLARQLAVKKKDALGGVQVFLVYGSIISLFWS